MEKISVHAAMVALTISADSARASFNLWERLWTGRSGLGQEGLEVVSQESSDRVELFGGDLHVGGQVTVEGNGLFINT